MQKPRQRHTAPTADQTTLNKQCRQLEEQLAFFVGKVEQLEAENKALRRENVSLRKENRQLHLTHQALKAEHQKLQGQLSQNSHNSHQPPSSDKPWDKEKANEKGKGQGKNGTKSRGKSPLEQQEQKQKSNGGQPGHKGHTLEAVAHPDHIQWHLPEGCKHCGRHFEPSDAVRSVGNHQVFDIPQPQMEVTEHRIGEVHCCGCTQRGEAPQGVQPAPVQYGPGVHALVVLLGNYYHLSLEKSRQLIGDLFGYHPSEGTLTNLQERCHKALEPAEDQIKTALSHQSVVHFDETGLDKKRWLHTATNEHLTYCFAHPKRGRAAIAGPDSLLPAFTGWAVHDNWGAYYKVGSAYHALCGAHLLRDLQAAWEQEGRPWVYEMQGWLLRLLQRVQSQGGSLPQHEHRGVWARFKALQRAGQAQEPKIYR
jgi:transposase